MFTKYATRASQVHLNNMTAMSTQGFKSTNVACASKKPSIGDAVTILQSKVSQINQVVSAQSLLKEISSRATPVVELQVTPISFN